KLGKFQRLEQRQVVEIGDFPWPPPGLSGGRRGQLLWSVCILAITGGPLHFGSATADVSCRCRALRRTVAVFNQVPDSTADSKIAAGIPPFMFSPKSSN
ncbi:MAG: hypothetical protein ACK6D5_01970, partial [Planctomyces sp.]